MEIYETEILKSYIRTCTDGWRLGWHERNGGNLTYRMTDKEVDICRPYFKKSPSEWIDLGIEAKNLAGLFFLATGSGKFLRNASLAPQDNLCILELNDSGSNYRVVWGLEHGGQPTSELPSHILNHSAQFEAKNGSHRVIYHAHTPNVIALTFVLPLTAKDFTNVLWRGMTECPIVFPQGIGVVPWMVPGGAEIALASSKLMKTFDAVIWAHHGTFCSAESLDHAFGLMQTIEKSAEIYIKALSCGQGIRQTITDDELLSVAKAFGVKLNEDIIG